MQGVRPPAKAKAKAAAAAGLGVHLSEDCPFCVLVVLAAQQQRTSTMMMMIRCPPLCSSLAGGRGSSGTRSFAADRPQRVGWLPNNNNKLLMPAKDHILETGVEKHKRDGAWITI